MQQRQSATRDDQKRCGANPEFEQSSPLHWPVPQFKSGCSVAPFVWRSVGIKD
jgi:hypothetical protein